ITDQQRKDHLSCYNNKSILKTPNINKIAKEGIKFSKFYCTNPICMPNRSTIFTGEYPSVHGVTTNGRNLPHDTRTFANILSENDYYTASFGKIHLNYFGGYIRGLFDNPHTSQEFTLPQDYPKLTNYSPYFGLSETKIVSGHGTLTGHPDYQEWMMEKLRTDEVLQSKLKIKPDATDKDLEKAIKRCFHIKVKESFVGLQVWKHKIPEELYTTTFVKDNTIQFLERFANGNYSQKNFLAIASFPDPHAPFTPPGKYFDMYKPEDIILPETFNNTHEKSSQFMRDHFMHTKKTEGTNDKDFPLAIELTEIEAKRVIAAMYGMEKMIDDAVGEILNALDKLGLAENTIIIYTTDHGELGGDHRFFFKGPFLYQGLINIPFLIKIPNSSQKGETHSLAASIDIPETILELAGISIPKSMQGKSLTPILLNNNEKIKDEIYIEMDDDFQEEKTRTLVTDEWRITIYNDFGEMYNLKKDPNEKNNLWNDEFFKDIKLDLILRLYRKSIRNIEKKVIRDCEY
ncbi:MAG: sulfatase, partial [Candidatus Hermodarchaeota archaeon]